MKDLHIGNSSFEVYLGAISAIRYNLWSKTLFFFQRHKRSFLRSSFLKKKWGFEQEITAVRARNSYFVDEDILKTG
jgi:hypothetical protein